MRSISGVIHPGRSLPQSRAMHAEHDMIPIAQYEWFLTFLGINLSWIWDKHFLIELDQGSMFKNSPRLVPKTKLTWKIHVLSIESKHQLEMKKKQRWTTKSKWPKQKAIEARKPNWKSKGNKLRHEHKKRRKEGEEKTHEDGRIGWMNTPLRGWRLQDECAMPSLEVTKNSQDKTKWGRHKALQFSLKLSIVSLIQNSNLNCTS